MAEFAYFQINLLGDTGVIPITTLGTKASEKVKLIFGHVVNVKSWKLCIY